MKKKNPNQINNHIAEPRQDRIIQVINTVILLLLVVVLAYPLYFVVIASISNPSAVNAGEVLLLPKDLMFVGYEKILAHKDIINGAKNTLINTVIATSLNVFLTMLGAYATSIKFPGRSTIMKLITFTMFFSAGMIPNYLLMKSLNLLDTRWALILPGMISVYNMTVARTFIQSNIPHELREAAQLDGCGHFRFFFSIVWPLSGSIIAIITLFYASGHWNSYMNAVLYIRDRSLYPLQMVMREILIQNKITADDMMNASDLEMIASLQHTADSMKYALIILTTAPMMVAYPFVQKYFVKGVTLGSVKG